LAILTAMFVVAAAPAWPQEVTEDWHRQVAIALQNGDCAFALTMTEAARLTKDPEADLRFGALYESGTCVE
jgi:tRNA A37 threonylcarbamoyladenosine synthetase subunit TsaC/SUA5/YrdC